MLPAEHQLSGRSIGERCGNEKPQRVPFGEDILGTGVQGKPVSMALPTAGSKPPQ